ncbi:MAG: hypothetical protein OMM_00153 [Candidatus Magnetoglobus multicellularis str. Araruama]|uniref:Uncharacterized protein n=1 Tax=Candidatus Magnetoglobus multicellularis str. Araruama TaxID=890399 RepID=A0A1V1PIB2_9BACT|nr:MAG: hypothetical protein OMM_00153 [Candidatus Magnetoglobus multicellularis str. Araruama]
MPKKDRLFYLLNKLDYEELEYILIKGLRKPKLVKDKIEYSQLVNLISKTLRNTASHSFVNAFRLEHEYPYKQILINVANKLQGNKTIYKLDDNHTEEEIEEEIIKLFEERSRKWWASLKSWQKRKIIDEINEMIEADLLQKVNKKVLIKQRVTKEVMDTIVAKGIVVSLVMVSAGGILGFAGLSLLDVYGWRIVTMFTGWLTGVEIFLSSGMTLFTLTGALGVGLPIWIGSTIIYENGPNYDKTIPTIIMLLSKVREETVRIY